MFAVIRSGGKQYRVAADDVVDVERLGGSPGDRVVFEEVLMLGGETPQVGAPLVEGASVAGEIVEQGRGAKVIVFKKRRRQNSRRKNGHRQFFTRVRITDVLTKDRRAAGRTAQPKAPARTPTAEKPAAGATAEPEAPPLYETPDGVADDLKKISGVGTAIEKKLHALGITQYEQVAKFTPDDIARVDDALNFKGRIERDDWVSQAKALAAAKKES